MKKTIILKLVLLNSLYSVCFIFWTSLDIGILFVLSLIFNVYIVTELRKLNNYSVELKESKELFGYISKWNTNRKNKIREKLITNKGDMFSLEKGNIIRCIDEDKDFKKIYEVANDEIKIREELNMFTLEKINQMILLSTIILATSFFMNLVININVLVNFIFIIGVLISSSVFIRFLLKQKDNLNKEDLYKQILLLELEDLNDERLLKKINKQNKPFVNDLYLGLVKLQNKVITSKELTLIKEKSMKDYFIYINNLLIRLKGKSNTKINRFDYLFIIYVIGYFMELSKYMDVIING